MVDDRASLTAALDDARTQTERAGARRREAEVALPQEAELRREHVREETRQLVASARSVVDDARAQQKLHRTQLDRAHRVVLMAVRLEQLPSADFTRSRIDRLRVEVENRRTATREAEREDQNARELLKQARNANVVTRRLRRLPRPEEQEPVAVAAGERAVGHQAELVASTRELTEAQQRLAETARLQAGLDQSRGLPSVDQAQSLLGAGRAELPQRHLRPDHRDERIEEAQEPGSARRASPRPRWACECRC